MYQRFNLAVGCALLLVCCLLQQQVAAVTLAGNGIPASMRLGDIIGDLSKPGDGSTQFAGGSGSKSQEAFRVTLTHASSPAFQNTTNSATTTNQNDDRTMQVVDFEPTAQLDLCDGGNNFILLGDVVVLVSSATVKNTLLGNEAHLRAAFGLEPTAPLPGAHQILSYTQPSLSVCGRLGLTYSGNVSLEHATREAEIAGSFFVEQLEASSGYSTVLTSHYASTSILPGSPGIAEVAPMDLWCQEEILIGSVGVQFPDMHLALYDNWGNPAVAATSAEHGAVSFKSHPPDWSPLPNMASTVKGSMNKGTHFISITGLVLNGTATRAHMFSEGSSTLANTGGATINVITIQTEEDRGVPMHYQVEMTLVGIHLGGRTEKCRRFELKPGPPHAMGIVPLGDHLTRHVASRQEPVFYTPLASAHVIGVTVRDIFGNALKTGPACSTPRPPKPFFDDFCIVCTVEQAGVTASRTNVVAHSDIVKNATASFFTLAPVAKPGWFDIKCVTNATQPVFSLSTRTSLKVIKSGDYSCFNGSEASFPQLVGLDPQNTVDVLSVFQDPSQKQVPMARVHLQIPFDADDDTANPMGYQRLPGDYKTWILVPRRGFIYIPLGLLSVMSFGSSYTTVSSAHINVTLPICQTANPTAIRKEIATWLFDVGDNSSLFYRRLWPASDPAFKIQIDLQVCYGSGISELEFMSVYCCERGSGECATSALANPVGILLVAGGTVVSIIIAAGTCWYLWSTAKQIPVHLTNRHHIDINDKTRVLLAHLLAPFVLWAHAYFIFSLQGTAAYFLFYVDILLPFMWGTACIVRHLLPLVIFTDPLYRGIGTSLLFFTQFLLSNCFIWSLSALHLNMKLLPYLVASALSILQCFWSISAAALELSPSVLQDKVPQHSIVPVNAALSMEYFAIAAMLFLFALNQQTELTPFGSVVGAGVMIIFSTFWNLSISTQVNEVFKKQFGKDATGASVMEQALVEARKQKAQNPDGELGMAHREMSMMMERSGNPNITSPAPEQGGGGAPKAGNERSRAGSKTKKDQAQGHHDQTQEPLLEHENAAVRGSAHKWLGNFRGKQSVPPADEEMQTHHEQSPAPHQPQHQQVVKVAHPQQQPQTQQPQGHQRDAADTLEGVPLPVGPAPVVAPPSRKGNKQAPPLPVAEPHAPVEGGDDTDALIAQLANSNMI